MVILHYYASKIPQKGLHIRRILEFRGINMNENSIPFSFINYAAHCTRLSGDVMKRPGHKNFNAVSHNRSRPEVLFLNLKWWS